MKVEIDLDALILKAAVRFMDRRYEHEGASLVYALQQQMPDDVQLLKRVRQQVKEYRKLTMWRD